jgi:hypothetical protein
MASRITTSRELSLLGAGGEPAGSQVAPDGAPDGGEGRELLVLLMERLSLAPILAMFLQLFFQSFQVLLRVLFCRGRELWNLLYGVFDITECRSGNAIEPAQHFGSGRS